MYLSKKNSGVEPRSHLPLFILITLIYSFVCGSEIAYAGEIIKVINGDLNSAIQKAKDGDTIQCDPKFQILTDKTFHIDKSISLFGLNAKLKDGVGRTEILLVTADKVHLADIQVTGNIGTIKENERTSLIKFEAEGFTIERVTGKDCLKDVICVQGSEGNNIKGGLIQDISGTNIGRDVVSIAGRYKRYKTLVSDLIIRRVKCFGSKNRGAVEVSDGSYNIKVDDVYSENSQYGVDVQTHFEGETNHNITITNVAVKNCSHVIRMATKANSNKNIIFKNISGTNWKKDSIPIQINNATNVTLENVKISGDVASGIIMEITKSNKVLTKSFTHNSKPVTIEQVKFYDGISDLVLEGKDIKFTVINSDLVHEAFEGKAIFTNLKTVDAPAVPSGGAGTKVGQTNFKATTNKALIQTHSSQDLSIPIDKAVFVDVSMLIGLKKVEQGDCKVRVRVFFDNGNSSTSSWTDLPGKAHTMMEYLSWKNLPVKGDGATKITELRIQLSQVASRQAAQEAYVDEIKVVSGSLKQIN